MPHVSVRDGVIRKLLVFVHRTMKITQLTHLTVPSSGTTSELVHPDSFPIIHLTRKPVGPNKVSFAENVEVIGPSPPLSPWGEEPNSPGEAQDSPDDTSQHVRDVITIVPPTYELFPFMNPFEDPELFSPLHFQSLPAPPGFAPINQPGEILAPAWMAARDWSSFI